MSNAIESAIKSGHGNAIVYATALGLIASDIIPTPADALYFEMEKKLRDKWTKGNISASKYWWYNAGIYYGLNPVWWALVMAAVIFTKGNYTKKAKVGIGIIGAGAVIAIIHKNIRQDVQSGAQQKLQNMQRLQAENNPNPTILSS